MAAASENGGARAEGGPGSRRRIARGLLVGGVGTALTVVPALTVRRVRQMRDEARSIAPLTLDLDLEGTEPALRVVVLGDSSSAGFRLDDAEQSAARRVARALHLREGRAVSLRCAARNGATAADVLANQVDAAVDADVVLIGVGANDAKDRVPSEVVEESLTELIGRVRELAADDAKVVLVGVPDLSVAPGLPWLARAVVRPNVRRVARVQQRVAAALGVPLVPVPREELTPDTFAVDGFHPGALGHERITAKVVAHL